MSDQDILVYNGKKGEWVDPTLSTAQRRRLRKMIGRTFWVGKSMGGAVYYRTFQDNIYRRVPPPWSDRVKEADKHL